MKREIKFRAKETSGKDWCYGIMHNEGINLFPVSVDMNTICQFPGMRDKNKKEIYDGDILKDEGVKDADDERNSGIIFVSRYTVETQDNRYTDFVDLDACVRNIVRQIDIIEQMDEDCFLCKYAKEFGSMEPSDSEVCKNCLCNPKIKYNRETHPMALKPKKDWTKEEKEKYNLL